MAPLEAFTVAELRRAADGAVRPGVASYLESTDTLVLCTSQAREPGACTKQHFKLLPLRAAAVHY